MAAIVQRLHSTVNKQLGLPNTFEYDCRTESSKDSDTDGEELSEGSSSPVEASETIEEEGTQKLECRLLTYFFNSAYHSFLLLTSSAFFIPIDTGKPSTSAATGMNNGYDFIKKPIGMKPLFNSLALQQYILLCAQVSSIP